ncbi:hypothetical protein Bca52824_033883 [Brassica carinata]|uniref:Uncharacterized protein n=1 Tax=Brassica carinata TaxID=52824 RepID=A0A8X7SFU3_BRACI|nr:hypothetical protein Bca52824_033883 [Brassica carinata]
MKLISYVRLGCRCPPTKWLVDRRGLVACTGCNRRLDISRTSLRCNRCVSPNVTGVIRYQMLILTQS